MYKFTKFLKLDDPRGLIFNRYDIPIVHNFCDKLMVKLYKCKNGSMVLSFQLTYQSCMDQLLRNKHHRYEILTILLIIQISQTIVSIWP